KNRPNRAQADATILSQTPPQNTRQYFSQEQQSRTIYRSRISTSTWSIVIRSTGNIVELYLIPARFVMALDSSDAHYKPLETFTAVVDCGTISWLRNGRPFDVPGHMENICERLFGQLISRSRFNQGSGFAFYERYCDRQTH